MRRALNLRTSYSRIMAIKAAPAQSAIALTKQCQEETMIQYSVYWAALGLVISTSTAMSEVVPDALAVEWQGQHPCEKLYEDAQIRAMRCTLPPGAVHVRHSHPGHLVYTVSGGKAKVQDDRGTREGQPRTGGFNNNPPTSWHEVANIGDTTLSFMVVEKKYEPVPAK
jgi:quercetin dioxygenase-like cupin family protein